MIEIARVVTVAHLQGTLGPLGAPPPNTALDAMVLAHLNNPPHSFGVYSARVSSDGMINGHVRVIIQAPDNIDQQAVLAAL